MADAVAARSLIHHLDIGQFAITTNDKPVVLVAYVADSERKVVAFTT